MCMFDGCRDIRKGWVVFSIFFFFFGTNGAYMTKMTCLAGIANNRRGGKKEVSRNGLYGREGVGHVTNKQKEKDIQK